MTELFEKCGRLRRLMVLTIALGCTFATLSGTLAAFAYSARPYADVAAENFV